MSDTASPVFDTAPQDEAADADGDTYTSITQGGDDCNDQDASVHPRAPERCNLVDDNCDGTADEGCPTSLDHTAGGDGIQWTCGAMGSAGPGAGLVLAFALLALRRAPRALASASRR